MLLLIVPYVPKLYVAADCALCTFAATCASSAINVYAQYYRLMQYTAGCHIVTQAALLPLITSLHFVCAHAQ